MTIDVTRPDVRLDIFIDPVCPWCHIGMQNLERALAAAPGHPFRLQWHPFRLNPDIPAEGVDKRSYLAARFGGEEKVNEVNERLRQVARDAGGEIDPDRPSRIPNTLDAHRLIDWAGIEGVQHEVVTLILQAYWDEGRDIGDAEVLADIAASAGMNRAATLRLLQSDADKSELIAREGEARRKGVNAVPTFLVAQQYVVNGAQPPEFWGNVIQEITKTEI
ncbi:DsbA family oxidoreductase [Pseudomonas sp. GX19020]|uniref:DsbA family oxidoreductase n=1 Tax=Pseudomonadota TaxID=1224 RepID=UPI000898CD38|nr:MULTISPECIES: DsbA family oxidoreductase [Pseudomonadota]MCL4065169.1 DsbA family oxidoreductase [Pseudomonas sp. GX19020]SEB92393.1 Predicted dithiol-disulfide isomerase, DsbA family [Rhodobacter sp. 24-YEA-8]